ncbi:BTAD domain-containing putative transcriptional regulator [Streptomyces sp. NPDC087844]|uniref:AfsR/SARP family transcriptional regulator n=1 Tax=Streptomyces sp. NPDC087844 TaxID=3365805 RepID=UPI0038040868
MSNSAVRFTVLGPVRAWRGSAEIGLGSPQQRVVLAALLLRQGLPVSAKDLIDAVWGDRPPASATNALRIYIHRLRRSMEQAGTPPEPVIESVGSGYRVHLASDVLDMSVFQDRLAKAQRMRREGNLAASHTLLRDALALWQGNGLADLPGNWAQIQRTRLDQLRLDALEAKFQTELRMGAHHEITAELNSVVADHVLDERFREILMLALYRSGRQAAALEVYQETHQLLTAELGVGPGPGLQHLHQRILRGDPALLSPEREPGPSSAGLPSGAGVPTAGHVPTAAPAQLPYDLPVFAGRHEEVTEVESLAEAGRRRDAGTTLCVVVGSAGVGKTTFIVHVAHLLAAHYPDGQIYLNLHGYDAQEAPVSIQSALRIVLESLGVAADRLPPDMDAQAALYRSLIAGRRVLLVLDNARNAHQIRPLLPAVPGCLTIVTSRNQLSDLVVKDGAHHLRLGALSKAEARDVLVRRLGADRVNEDPLATRKIIDRSAQLPLALALIAARARTRPETSLAAVADELCGAPNVMDVLSDADSSLDVRSVFSWSYVGLAPQTARLFRMMAVAPIPDCSLATIAALAALPVSRARSLLAELTTVHLVDEPTPGHFVMHDLLREYAAELLRERNGEETGAFDRLLAYYLHTAYTAARTLAVNLPPLDLEPVPAGVDPENITDPERAVAWFDKENEALLHVTERAGTTPGREAQAWQLAWSLMEYLQRTGRWEDQITLQNNALAAVLRGRDRLGQAHVHRNLARAHAQSEHVTEARHHLRQALVIFEELDDLIGQARCHGNFALILARQGDYAAALPHVHRAVEQFELAGDPTGQASALNNLGWTYGQLGEHRKALGYCRRALELLREVGDRVAQAATWDSLGYIHHQLGDHRQALGCYQRALHLDRQLGDTFNEAETMEHLAETCLATGAWGAAHDAWAFALKVFEELDPQAADRVRARLRDLRNRVTARSGAADGDHA